MERNVGGLERKLRLAGGLIGIGLGLFGPLGRSGKMIAMGIGGMQLATGLTRYCPVNQALHVNSYKNGTLKNVWQAVKRLSGTLM